MSTSQLSNRSGVVWRGAPVELPLVYNRGYPPKRLEAIILPASFSGGSLLVAAVRERYPA